MEKSDLRFDAILKYIKRQDRIVFYAVGLTVVFDTLCFFQLMYGVGSSEYWAVPFGLMFGLITNILAFFVGDKGLGEFYRIRSISLKGNQGERDNVVKEDVRRRKRNALIVFFIGSVLLIAVQGALFNLKNNRINENNEKVKIAEQACINLKEDDKHKRLPDEQRKEEEIECSKKVKYVYYSNVPYEIDFATMILPIFTSVVSFIVGLLYGKFVDVYEENLAAAYGNLMALEETLKTKCKELNKEYEPKLKEFEKKRDDLLRAIHNNEVAINYCISKIETAGDGEIVGLRNAISKLILNGDDADYGKLINKTLADKLKMKFPQYYNLHLIKLHSDLINVCDVVHLKLSSKAQEPDNFKEHKIEKIPEYKDKLNEIKTPSNNLFKS